MKVWSTEWATLLRFLMGGNPAAHIDGFGTPTGPNPGSLRLVASLLEANANTFGNLFVDREKGADWSEWRTWAATEVLSETSLMDAPPMRLEGLVGSARKQANDRGGDLWLLAREIVNVSSLMAAELTSETHLKNLAIQQLASRWNPARLRETARALRVRRNIARRREVEAAEEMTRLAQRADAIAQAYARGDEEGRAYEEYLANDDESRRLRHEAEEFDQ